MTFREWCLTVGLTLTVVVTAIGPASAKDVPKTHEVIAKVVAVDLQAKSIQAHVGTGPSQNFPVVGAAADRLDQLPIGQMFKLTFQDNDDPARQVVIAIKRAKHAPQL